MIRIHISKRTDTEPHGGTGTTSHTTQGTGKIPQKGTGIEPHGHCYRSTRITVTGPQTGTVTNPQGSLLQVHRQALSQIYKVALHNVTLLQHNTGVLLKIHIELVFQF
jgi:hypothetical protein